MNIQESEIKNNDRPTSRRKSRRTNKKNYYNKVVIISITMVILTLLLIYSCSVLYFKNHFYLKTTINSVNVSGNTIEEVNNKLEKEANNYILKLEGRDGRKSEIFSSDMDLKYKRNDEINKLKDSQNPFNIFKAIFINNEYKIPKTISFNKEKLKNCVDKTTFFVQDKIVNPKNAIIKYNNNKFEIITEVMGNKVKKDALYKEVENAVLNDIKIINLEKSNCYENPKYTSASTEVINAKKTIDTYMQSVINYDIRGNKEVVDGSKINTFIEVDENFNVNISNKKVKAYIDTLAYNYNTLGITRDFLTSSGQTVKVKGGNYGWAINRAKETEALVQAIKEGKTTDKKPIYYQTTPYYNANEIGNSYVEIDLKKQHLWIYKNGNLIAHDDVVTGNLSSNHGTPEGVYILNYKEKNAILRGPNYAAPVKYWMPFNNDIGIHDATWRKKFGGEIYLNSGSHGCINCPYKLAEHVFNNVQPGTPIVCHY